MRSSMKFIGVVCAVLGASALLTACGTDDSATADTFGCTGGTTSLRCVVNTQYCEQASDGTTTTTARCLAVPAGCTDSPCGNCLMSGSNGITTCTSARFGTSRATTVTVRR